MFNSLNGKLNGKDSEKIYLLTEGGIEWEIWTGEITSSALPEKGEEVRIYTYVHHREDQLRIFGFGDIRERKIFLDLIKVEGIGPKLALKILSGISAEDFVSAVESENLSVLQAIPGLGQKSAQKIILKLKGKLAPAVGGSGGMQDDIVLALTGMGFDKKEAKQAVSETVEELKKSSYSEEKWESELLKQSIRRMSQKK